MATPDSPEKKEKPADKTPSKDDILGGLAEEEGRVDDLINQTGKLKEEAEERARKRQELIEQTRKTLENTKPIKESFAAIATDLAQIILDDPAQLDAAIADMNEQFNVRLVTYQKTKEETRSSMAGNPEKLEILDRIQAITELAHDKYAPAQIRSSELGKNPPDQKDEAAKEAHKKETAQQWAIMIGAMRGLKRAMDDYDRVRGDYSNFSKPFTPLAQRYVEVQANRLPRDRKTRDAILNAYNQDMARFTRNLEEIQAFKDANPDPELDDDNTRKIRAQILEKEALYHAHREKAATSVADAAVMFFAMAEIDKALTPLRIIEQDRMDPAERKNHDTLTAEQGGVFITGIPERNPKYLISTSHPAFDIAADRQDIAFKVLDDGRLMELTPMDWKKVGGNPDGMEDGSWSRVGVQPVGEAVARRTDSPEPPAAVGQPQGNPNREEAPTGNNPFVEPPKKEVPTQPAATPKPNVQPRVATVPPQKIEQPAVVEKAPEGIRAVLKQDGSIDVPTQETIYIAYYLPSGERQRNYVRFPESDISRWSIDGMCVAERNAAGWTVRPEAGLQGTFLFNVAGTTTNIKLTGNGSERASEKKETIDDPEFPFLSRLSSGK